MQKRDQDSPTCCYVQISLLSRWEDHDRFYDRPDITRRKSSLRPYHSSHRSWCNSGPFPCMH
ncbi:hypothetical protein BDR03DRAFT_968405 [Suillus americanus]|nr:hypothetical protein BDR03DRAFT_968405 [Suillus americanus]